MPEPFLARPLNFPVFCIVDPIVPVPAKVLPMFALPPVWFMLPLNFYVVWLGLAILCIRLPLPVCANMVVTIFC